jgi:hypothetical protein
MNNSDGSRAAPAGSGHPGPPAAPTRPTARRMEAEPGPGADISAPRDRELSGHEPASADGNRPPGRGIQAWACLLLPDGTRRLAAVPASPRQASTEPAGRAREPELEAEP